MGHKSRLVIWEEKFYATLVISSFVIDTTAPTVSSGVTSFYNSSDGINWSFGNSYAHPNIGLYGITFLD